MVGRRKSEEEEFEFTRTRTRLKENKKSGKPASWKRLTEGWIGAMFYVFLGIGLALVAKQTLTFALATEMPVVAVVSQSMQHDHAEQTHYQWLMQHLSYSESYVDSWPVPTGFFVGDMPVVQGSDTYNVGDVIVYSVPSQDYPIIHRIIKINEDGTYQTKGDNNVNQLPYEFSVRKEQIHGKVIFIVPKLGYFKVILTKVLGVG